MRKQNFSNSFYEKYNPFNDISLAVMMFSKDIDSLKKLIEDIDDEELKAFIYAINYDNRIKQSTNNESIYLVVIDNMIAVREKINELYIDGMNVVDSKHNTRARKQVSNIGKTIVTPQEILNQFVEKRLKDFKSIRKEAYIHIINCIAPARTKLPKRTEYIDKVWNDLMEYNREVMIKSLNEKWGDN